MSYKDKFNAQMKKAGINSLGDLKTDAEKKAFFKAVDKSHTADHEEVTESKQTQEGYRTPWRSTSGIDAPKKKKPTYLPPVKRPVAKRSNTRTGLKNGDDIPEGGPGSGPQFASATIKKAYGILNDPRYKQGNYSGAAKAIEKLGKGLSNHPDVKNAMKRANESKENEMKQESNKYHETKPGSIQDTVAQMQVNETKSVTMKVKEFSEMVETYLNKGGVSHNLSPAVLGGGFKVLPLQAVREFIDTYNRHFLTNYKAEEFVVRDELKG
jgi:hypothetical protein